MDHQREEEEDLSSMTSIDAIEAVWMHICSGGVPSGQKFRPEYTHQAFPDETIRGYQGLKIDIFVDDLSLEWRVEVHYDKAEEGDRRNDLVSCLSKLIPTGTAINIREGQEMEVSAVSIDGMVKAGPFPSPPGKQVLSYPVQPRDSSHDLEFVVLRALATDEGASCFHGRVQKLAPWFIETGDDVAIEEGEWEMLYLCRREAAPEEGALLHFAGYLTVFAFSNPLKGKCLRVCQALILPPYQRQGHGQRLLRYVYELARASEVVFEVTVEDPAPGFTAMRNLTDVQELHALLKDESLVASLPSLQGFQGLSETDLGSLHRRLKLAKKQIQIAFECLKHHEDDDKDKAEGETKDVQKQYRLMVKRRLAKECKGEFVVQGVLQKERFQRHLDEAFQELKDEYQAMGQRVMLSSAVLGKKRVREGDEATRAGESGSKCKA